MSNIHIFCFTDNRVEKRGAINMCRILRELHGKDPSYILDKYYMSNKIPIDIVSIAKNIGINLGSINFTDLEKSTIFKPFVEERGHILGAVFINGEDVQIVYDNRFYEDTESGKLSNVDKKDKLLKRQRFTIAHEIAHCCLHMKESDKSHIEYRTDQNNDDMVREREANIFAGELLIPRTVLLNICSIFGKNIPVNILSDIFKVSNNVMKARLVYLKEQGFLDNAEFIDGRLYN